MHKKKSRNILWIHQNFVTARQAGNSRAIHTVAALLEEGCNVDIITADAGYLDDANNSGQSITIDKEKGLTIHRLPLPITGAGYSNRTRSYIFFVIKSIKYALTLSRPDCILCSTPPLLQVIPCLLLSAIYKIPFIYEMRDIWPKILFETGLLKSKVLGVGLRIIEAAAFRYGNNCISVTPGFQEYSLSMGVDEANTIIIPTGGEPNLKLNYALAGIKWRKKNKFENKRVAIYSGSFNEHYGIKNLINAAITICENNKNVVFCFAGGGRDKDIVIKAANNHDSIHYLGALPKDELKTILAGSDFSLHTPIEYPMINIMFSGKVFDYMAAALPVISTVNGHTGMILQLSKGGVVAGGYSSGHIVSAVEKLLAMSDTELTNMGESAHAWLTENLDVNLLARQNALFIIETSDKLKITWGIKRLLWSVVPSIIDAFNDRSSSAIAPLEENNEEFLSEKIITYFKSEAPSNKNYSNVLSIPLILSGSNNN